MKAGRVVLLLACMAGVGAVMPSVAKGAEFHSHNVGGSVAAYWSSCETAAVGEQCADTSIEAAAEANDLSSTGPSNLRDCVRVRQFHLIDGVSPRTQYWTTTIEDPANSFACGSASVHVAASLANGSVRGELPMENCYPAVVTCVPTTPIRVSLDWQSTGEVSSRPNIVIRYFSGVRCQGHLMPSRIAGASVSGQIDGLPDPLGPFEGAGIGFAGETWVGCYD
jgi:hypothetical protein